MDTLEHMSIHPGAVTAPTTTTPSNLLVTERGLVCPGSSTFHAL
eukprot:SAG22_NODE_515_length_9566_cov_29.378789_1_plen_44_part_00